MIGYVPLPVFISFAFLFGFPFFFFFPFFLFLIYNSSKIPVIAFSYLICGFLNCAVPFYIVI